MRSLRAQGLAYQQIADQMPIKIQKIRGQSAIKVGG